MHCCACECSCQVLLYKSVQHLWTLHVLDLLKIEATHRTVHSAVWVLRQGIELGSIPVDENAQLKRRDVRSWRLAAIDWYGTSVQGSTGGSLGSGIDIANRGQIRFYRKTPTACSVKLTISYEVGHSPPENVRKTKMHHGFPKSPSVHRQLFFCICEDGPHAIRWSTCLSQYQRIAMLLGIVLFSTNCALAHLLPRPCINVVLFILHRCQTCLRHLLVRSRPLWRAS